jgi:hypothetical protein
MSFSSQLYNRGIGKARQGQGQGQSQKSIHDGKNDGISSHALADGIMDERRDIKGRSTEVPRIQSELGLCFPSQQDEIGLNDIIIVVTGIHVRAGDSIK